MISIRFLHPDQTQQDIQARPGDSLMKAAVDANVKGIEADCGGSLTCATCHVIVDPAWASKLPPPSADELSMLEMTASPREQHSRLSCQIVANAELDGLRITMPATQY